MRTFHDYRELPEDARGAVIALGNFDGVHHGHRSVFDETRRIARRLGVPMGVVTFEPHPRSVLAPESLPFRLTSWKTKARALAALGVDVLVFVPFDHAFASQSPDMFVEGVLVEGVGARHVVIGEDFRFGVGRSGTPEDMARLGEAHGFGVTVLPELKHATGDVFSSTNIRRLLQEGEPVEAAKLLGRWWEIEGLVQAGDRRGRTIGFPTANIDLGPLLQPAIGVYAVRVGVGDDERVTWHDGVANLGRRPTVDGRNLLLEVHVFDYSGDLYERPIRVQFVAYIRPERKFDGLDALQAQIARDCETARAILATTGEAPPPP